MHRLTRRNTAALAAATTLLATAGALALANGSSSSAEQGLPWKAREFQEYSASANGADGGESFEAKVLAEQFAQARTAPGGVNPGGYAAAVASLNGPNTGVGGNWSPVTNVPYDADDPAYRDYYSNSSGGSGLVGGRVTGLAASGSNVYAAGADGGVFRSTNSGGTWTSITDNILSLSSGTLELSGNALWYATGEANTGATSYVGSGVYALPNPASGTFSQANKVGGTELDGTIINQLRFGGGKVWAATGKGVYSHSATVLTGAWTPAFAPNPLYLPGAKYYDGRDGDDAANAPYLNIVNDIAIDPAAPTTHIIAGIGWRSGALSTPQGSIYYNGFYETKDGGATWQLINPGGAINAKDIGNVTFAFSATGDRLYVVNQSPILINKATGTSAANTVLDGVYVSNTGNPAGPWNKIADSRKLANSGSALKQSIGGKGYGPGVQSWYNQFLAVDPADRDHVYLGLEEVYETRNGGSSWTTPGPYWNFYFSCWAPDSVYPPNGAPNRCPQTTHPDQHSVAISGGKLYVGNDGGVYRRPVQGAADAAGHGTDWTSLNNGTLTALQYYAVGAGTAKAGNAPGFAPGSTLVSGGLQDNGGSIQQVGSGKMSSNFGGDGGDVLVNPTDGCQIIQEYVALSMRVTKNCARNNGAAFLDPNVATTYDIAPADPLPRFIAPFAADAKNIDSWVAGGNVVWGSTKGFGYDFKPSNPGFWTSLFSLGAGHSATAVAVSGGRSVVGWCGPCNNSGFTRGIAVGSTDPAVKDWKQITLPATFPNRYVGGAAIDPANSNHLVVVLGGFSRKWTEGPGAGYGHVYESADGGATWANVDGSSFPDIPASTVKVLPSGGVIVGTDLATFYRAAGAATWQRLGSGLPLTTVMDLEVFDGYVYAATHGRGIWRMPAGAL